eukprot:CAMPEP_0170541662 /NCGR_PEP_ID=MMETSP0211-20121228/1338_1 /TAXON_ID=311385 /ORGANISM="Pseudokeronopsis sp., Strain OXSARD2" /LENGTH=62 /DNA_ID=CAMNT_0010844485 /DNA_START=408 /DNA_END=596 /DNA_ORIENTATION=-
MAEQMSEFEKKEREKHIRIRREAEAKADKEKAKQLEVMDKKLREENEKVFQSVQKLEILESK